MTCLNFPFWKCSMFTCCWVCLISRVVCICIILFHYKEKELDYVLTMVIKQCILLFCVAACWEGCVMGIWLTVPFTHSPVSSFLLFFWYFAFPPTFIFTWFPCLHMRVYNHCLSLAFFLSLPLLLLRYSKFFSLFHSTLWGQRAF